VLIASEKVARANLEVPLYYQITCACHLCFVRHAGRSPKIKREHAPCAFTSEIGDTCADQNKYDDVVQHEGALCSMLSAPEKRNFVSC